MKNHLSKNYKCKLGLILSLPFMVFVSTSFATTAKTLANTTLSSNVANRNVLENIDQTLTKMNATNMTQWSKLSSGLTDLGTDIEIMSKAFVAPSGENLATIMGALPLFSSNYSNVVSRGSGTDEYMKLSSNMLCGGENGHKICQASASGKAAQLNPDLRSTTILSFSSPDPVGVTGYIQNLLGLGGATNSSNRTELPSILAQSASQSMALQALSHIASQNTDKYPTKYSRVSSMLASFYGSSLITGLPSETNQISVLKSLTSSALLLTLTQRVIMQQNQTSNALNAAILAQQSVIEKQNQQMIEQNKQRNRYLRELVFSRKRGGS